MRWSLSVVFVGRFLWARMISTSLSYRPRPGMPSQSREQKAKVGIRAKFLEHDLGDENIWPHSQLFNATV